MLMKGILYFFIRRGGGILLCITPFLIIINPYFTFIISLKFLLLFLLFLIFLGFILLFLRDFLLVFIFPEFNLERYINIWIFFNK